MDKNLENLFPQVGELTLERLNRDALAMRDYIVALETRIKELEAISHEREEATTQVTTTTSTGNPTTTGDDEESPDVGNSLAEQITWVAELIRNVANRPATAILKEVDNIVEGLAANVAVGAGTQAETILTLKRTQRSLGAAFIRLRATATELAALGEALIATQAQLTGLNGELDGQASALLELTSSVTALSGTVEAQATAILALQTEIDNVLTSAFISFQLNTPPVEGILAEINIRARAAIEEDFIDSGLSIQLYEEASIVKSRIAILADKFVVASQDGAIVDVPFLIEDGVVKMRLANIDEIIAGVLRNSPNTFRIDLAAGSIEGYHP